MSESIDSVVAGHICLDVTPAFLTGGASLGEILRPGCLVQVGSAVVSTGGSVSNTGLPMRRLGVNVRLMGKCGDDMFAQALMAKIRAEAPGAEAGMIVVPGEDTSYSVVINPPGIDRIFLHCHGANDTFAAADIDLATVAKARWFHFGYPPLMAKTYADGGGELAEIFRKTKALGVTTSLDMARPDPAGRAGAADWRAILARALPMVDVFTPSIEELLFMLRRAEFDRLIAQAGDGDMLAHIDGGLMSELGQQCLRMGAAVVLIKCGWYGLYVATAGAERFARGVGRGMPRDLSTWQGRELFEPGYRVEKVVSATGAGDCAIAAFITSGLRDCTLDNALRNACAVGAQNVTAADSISGIKTWEQTLAQVAARPLKYDIPLPMPGFAFDAAERHYVGSNDRR